jgi:hypothetical protein
MTVHLTDTCRWHLYDSFDTYSQHKIDHTFKMYQEASHRLNILCRYNSASLDSSRSVMDTHLVWDTGASIGLTPFSSDLIDYLPLDGITVKDIAQTNTVLGIGTIMWKLPTTKEHPVYIPAVAYHMPDCDIHLFSPQYYFKLHGGDAKITAHKVIMHLPNDHVVDIPINTALNLPKISSPHPRLKNKTSMNPIFSLCLSQTFWTYLVLPSPSTARPSQMSRITISQVLRGSSSVGIPNYALTCITFMNRCVIATTKFQILTI